MKEKMMYQDEINMKKRNIQDRDILYAQDYVLYRNLDKTKTQLKYVGAYLITNRDGDFHELTSLTKEKKPFYAHARNLKRYHLREGVDPIDIALMDKNEYLLESIVDFKCTSEDLKIRTSTFLRYYLRASQMIDIRHRILNARTHSSTGFAPYHMLFGTELANNLQVVSAPPLDISLAAGDKIKLVRDLDNVLNICYKQGL
jgi:hypothetical protein